MSAKEGVILALQLQEDAHLLWQRKPCLASMPFPFLLEEASHFLSWFTHFR